MNLGLKGRRALVLAASRGLGYACARGLAQEGCDLVICSRDEARIQAAAEQIRKDTGARVEALAADVSNAAEAERLVGAAVSAYGGLEILVHNAGGPPASARAASARLPNLVAMRTLSRFPLIAFATSSSFTPLP